MARGTRLCTGCICSIGSLEHIIHMVRPYLDTAMDTAPYILTCSEKRASVVDRSGHAWLGQGLYGVNILVKHIFKNGYGLRPTKRPSLWRRVHSVQLHIWRLGPPKGGSFGRC